jgi:hypothetical protein
VFVDSCSLTEECASTRRWKSAQWAGILEKDPCDALEASIAVAYAADYEYSVHGDLNARTGSKLAYPTDPPRCSKDTAQPSTRGNWLCNLFGDYGIAFVSGATCFGPDSGNFTSFQGAYKTVIDYVGCSKSSFEKIESFTVRDRVQGYDHSATVLNLRMNFDAQEVLFASPKKKRKVDFSLPNESELDKLSIATLEAGKDETRKLLDLYGPVTSATAQIQVTVHGVCLNANKISAAAGAATYWGPNARLNTVKRVPGTQTGPRAELVAIILALQQAPQFKSIIISTRSHYGI